VSYVAVVGSSRVVEWATVKRSADFN